MSKILGNTDKRSIYFRYSDKWLQDRILYRTFSNSSSYNSGTKIIREKGDNSEGGQFFIGKRGNPTSSGNSRRVHFDNIFGTEEDRRHEANNQFKTSKSVYTNNTFQNGNFADSSGFNSEGRFSDQFGLERCIFQHSSSSRSQEISSVLMGKTMLRVSMSPIRSEIIPSSFYEMHKTTDSTYSIKRPQRPDLYRRLPLDDSVFSSKSFTNSGSDVNLSESRFYNKYGEVVSDSDARSNLFRVFDKHVQNDGLLASRKDNSFTEGNSKVIGQLFSQNSPSGQGDRTYSLNISSSLPRPPPLSFFGKRKNASVTINSVLSSKNEVISASDRGIELVDEKCRGLQWETYSNSGPFCNFNDRCVKEGMGSCAEWDNNVRPLVSSGSTFAYQHFGTSSSIFCIASTGSFDTQSTYSSANRQQVSCCLYQSHGRNTFKCNGCNSKKDLVLDIDEKQSHFLGTHPWSGESTSGFSQQTFSRPNRMEIRPTNFSPIYTNTISTSSGLVCQQAQSSAGEICVLAARSTSMENQCFLNFVEKPTSLRISPLQFDYTSTTEGLQRQVYTTSSNTTLDDSTLVPPGSRVVMHDSFAVAKTKQNTDSTTRSGEVAPFGENTSTCRMDSLRKRFENKGFSERATELLCKSWRSKTNKQYQSAWKSWLGWCSGQLPDPFSPSVGDIVEFLSDEFHKGKSYSSINTLRSSLSSILNTIDGFAVGKHPTVIRLLKGVYNSKPPMPKYCITWDVSIVLSYMKTLPCNEDLTLKELSHKLAILIALVSADRGQTLSLLDLDFLSILPKKAIFVIMNQTKTSKPGKPLKKVVLPAFDECSKLCVKKALECYIQKTKILRQPCCKRLFISYLKPYKRVTSTTIARWIKLFLIKCGITGFGAHSTRSASTSCVFEAGLSVTDIMKTADWSQQSTFSKFYKRQTVEGMFGRMVLQKSSI